MPELSYPVQQPQTIIEIRPREIRVLNNDGSIECVIAVYLFPRERQFGVVSSSNIG